MGWLNNASTISEYLPGWLDRHCICNDSTLQRSPSCPMYLSLSCSPSESAYRPLLLVQGHHSTRITRWESERKSKKEQIYSPRKLRPEACVCLLATFLNLRLLSAHSLLAFCLRCLRKLYFRPFGLLKELKLNHRQPVARRKCAAKVLMTLLADAARKVGMTAYMKSRQAVIHRLILLGELKLYYHFQYWADVTYISQETEQHWRLCGWDCEYPSRNRENAVRNEANHKVCDIVFKFLILVSAAYYHCFRSFRLDCPTLVQSLRTQTHQVVTTIHTKSSIPLLESPAAAPSQNQMPIAHHPPVSVQLCETANEDANIPMNGQDATHTANIHIPDFQPLTTDQMSMSTLAQAEQVP